MRAATRAEAEVAPRPDRPQSRHLRTLGYIPLTRRWPRPRPGRKVTASMGWTTKRALSAAITSAIVVLAAASCSLASLDELKGSANAGDAGADTSPGDGSGCIPTSCAAKGAECGSIPDGCGGVVECGSCDADLFCGGAGPNKCGTTPCVAHTCASWRRPAAQTSDGCGKVLDCGTCTAPETCGGGGAENACGCTPRRAPIRVPQCGTISDGCGNQPVCGVCTLPAVCSNNSCGCTPRRAPTSAPSAARSPTTVGTPWIAARARRATSVAAQGRTSAARRPASRPPARRSARTAASISDGCGGTLSCGTCTQPEDVRRRRHAQRLRLFTRRPARPSARTAAASRTAAAEPSTVGELHRAETCGGGGTPNVCGCSQDDLRGAGQGLRQISDGCGGTLNCGSCTAPDTCSSGVCVCTPTTCSAQGVSCGTLPNGCGGNLNCGSCTAPSTCVGGSCSCVPNPDPCPANKCAGTASDGCGGTVTCSANCGLAGECPCAGGSCSGNYCNCNPGPCV